MSFKSRNKNTKKHQAQLANKKHRQYIGTHSKPCEPWWYPAAINTNAENTPLDKHGNV